MASTEDSEALKDTGGVLEDCVVETKTLSSLRVFPEEIREMIFGYVVMNEGPQTGLIAALRGEKMLYGEVLGVLFREFRFVLSKEKQDAYHWTPRTVLKRITKISLENLDSLMPMSNVSVYFPTGTKITDIRMELRGSRVDVQHFYDVMKLWFTYFGTVRKFTLVWSQPWRAWTLGSMPVIPKPPKALKDAIKVANKRLKKEALCFQGTGQLDPDEPESRRIPGPGFSEERTFSMSNAARVQELEIYEWTWEAEGAGVLAWDSGMMR